MYRGKFDAKKRSGADAEPVIPLNQPNDFDLELEIPSEPVSQASVGMPDSDSVETEPAKTGKTANKKREVRIGGVIFYTLYLLFVAGFAISLMLASRRFEGWLADYQAAQPDILAQEIFDRIWSEPDWSHIYDLAGLEDTAFESRDAFASYMEARVADRPLSWAATTAGLSADRCYAIFAGNEIIASFTMNRSAKPVNGIPQWETGSLTVQLSRSESVTIQKASGYQVSVNGIALDDSYTVRATRAVAESYLPDGLPGLRVETQVLTGLLVEPQITVTDRKGQPVEVIYDPETDLYYALAPGGSPEITGEQQAAAMKAGRAYALYLVGKASDQDLRQYFDSGCNVYKTIRNTPPWAQEVTNPTISRETVSEYRSYSDTLFSARVRLDLTATLDEEEATLSRRVDTTLFFVLRDDGWKCVEMTDLDLSGQIEEVRITFISQDVVLTSRFYETGLKELPVPIVSDPTGKVFSGWYRQVFADDGTMDWELVFAPSDSGSVALPAGSALEPMTLYALYEPAAAAPDNSTEETN